MNDKRTERRQEEEREMHERSNCTGRQGAWYRGILERGERGVPEPSVDGGK